MKRRLSRQRRISLALMAILIGTFMLSAAWALSSPLPNVPNWGNYQPDEGSNLAVIEYMARHRAFPTYDLTYYPTYHPPLYHGLAALLFLLLHSVIGDDPTIRLLRILTAFCGVGVVYLTYRATRLLAPVRTALFAAAIVALLPMRASLGGGLNNENLAALGAAGALAALVGGVQGRGGFTNRRLVVLTLWILVAIGSKVTSLGLLLAAVVAFVGVARRDGKPLANALRQGAIVVAASALTWGWWFWRNQIVYGDPLVSKVVDRYWDSLQFGFPQYAAQSGKTAIRYALRLTLEGWKSFWGAFDGFGRFLPGSLYVALFAFQAIAAGGLVIRFGELRRLPRHRRVNMAILALAVGAYLAFISLIYYKYNWRHYSPQGRYFFGMLLPFGMLTAVGWHTLFSAKRRVLDGLVVGVLFVLNLYLLYVISQRLPFFAERSLPAHGIITGSVIEFCARLEVAS